MDIDLFQKIRNYEQNSSGKQKRLAQYVLSHFEQISFQTVADIARKAEVSDATVVRLSKALGYEGFPELKEKFQRAILEKLFLPERLNRIADFPDNLRNLVSRVFEGEIQNVKETEKELEIGNVKKIVDCIIKARRKYVVGLRASSGCAYLLGRFLNQILPHVITILNGDSRLIEGLRNISKRDILVVICYPRYTKATIEAVQFANDHKSITVAITDSKLSPVARLSKYSLIAPANSHHFFNSYTGCISMINLLVSLIIHMDKTQAKKNFREWEKALQNFHFNYENGVDRILPLRS